MPKARKRARAGNAQDDGPEAVRQRMITNGLAIGVGLGTAVGLAIGNIGLGIALGAAIGMVVGAGLANSRRCEDTAKNHED